MKVAIIGDIHGTTKWIDGYMDILKNHPDVDKIICCGDHFDPYGDLSLEIMVERFEEFLSDCTKDKRIVSLIGNHDIEGYIIDGMTNRTMFGKSAEIIGREIQKMLPFSYMAYRIDNYLFSHAGLSNTWMERHPELDVFKQGWEKDELQCFGFFRGDYSGYGQDNRQGPTWIRPEALISDMYKDYNQVVGHTRVHKIVKVQVNDKEQFLHLVDNAGQADYLLLEIHEETHV